MNVCDYLILTASNAHQAAIYRRQLQIRHQLGFLAGIGKTLVVPDLGGKRIGSGGSTLCCLMEVLREELSIESINDEDAWKKAFDNKRVLIIHAGGDSKRLPAYGPCGKLFVPVPGRSDSPVPLTLFDKQLDTYLSLFDKNDHTGQFIITSGDVFLKFKSDPLECKQGVLTGFCCPASAEQASRHGVFCLGPQQSVRLYLQKPSFQQQQKYQALNNYNQAMLDIGIMAFDGNVAIQMLKLFGLSFDENRQILFETDLAKTLIGNGLDFYRELCCVFGSEATKDLHRQSAWDSGSVWTQQRLSDLFDRARSIQFKAQPLSRCDFLDFGSARQIIDSGYRLVHEHAQNIKISDSLCMNTTVSAKGSITGSPVWVEGCCIHAELELEGNNIVTGIDLEKDLFLDSGQCLDVMPGKDSQSNTGFFIRCYGIEDDFKSTIAANPKHCNIPIRQWIQEVGICEDDIWPEDIESEHRSLFNAKLFPFVSEHSCFNDYLWMFTPAQAEKKQIEQWKSASRFSYAQIPYLTDDESFWSIRQSNRVSELSEKVPYLFRPESVLSASELSYMLTRSDNVTQLLADALITAHACSKSDSTNREDIFISSRILHSLGSIFEQTPAILDQVSQNQSQLSELLSAECIDWLGDLGLLFLSETPTSEWASNFKNAAFKLHSNAILQVKDLSTQQPESCLRVDEIVWSRAPARLDIAGGWTDTPPYALEWGGAVLNAAINLNGQPPIQAYLRVIDEPLIKITSIDLGLQVVIRSLDELTNYADVTSGFSLVKAALLQELFSAVRGRSETKSLEQLLTTFGGGIELTTLAAIPKGSGLGTSSIMGAVIVAAINRAIGKELSDKELFNAVLKLEQALTTGGGWQDQIGGVLEGVKLILTESGMVPDPSMQYLRRDLIEPELNDCRTLLYYTGITRLAKNILQEVVGRYLNRNRYAMSVLGQIRQAAFDGAQAFAKKDYPGFGRMLDRSWQLNKALDPNSSNDKVELLFDRISPHVHGAKLLGAGGGGFVLMACKSKEDADFLHQDLTINPSQPNARFFNYDISSEGLVVTVC